MEIAIYNPHPTQYREFNSLLGRSESTKPVKHINVIRVFEELLKKYLECPVCESDNIRLYFIDDNGKPCKPNTDVLSRQCECSNCGYDDEIAAFDPDWWRMSISNKNKYAKNI